VAIYTDLATVRALPGLEDETEFPDSLLNDCIARADEIVTDYCGPWAPTSISKRMAGGSGSVFSTRIPALRSVDACTVDGDVQDVAAWSVDFYGDVYADVSFYGATQVEITVTAGIEDTAPVRLAHAATILAGSYATDFDSATPERALAVQSEFGQIQLAQAGGRPDRPTAYPDINAVLNRFRGAVKIG